MTEYIKNSDKKKYTLNPMLSNKCLHIEKSYCLNLLYEP